MNKSKWYHGGSIAEEYDDFLIELTDDEYEAVKKFIIVSHSCNDSYCGWVSIADKGFDNREDAKSYREWIE